MVSPAGFHAFIKGLCDLLRACDCTLKLLTHLFSLFKVERVTMSSLNQKYSSKAATASGHCKQR